jgi:hypothetical protein
MNDAHLHLVVNHFPIIGTILGLGTLVAGILLKNNSVKYCLLPCSICFCCIEYGYGEGAEEMVEDIQHWTPNYSRHEELAEKLALVLYLLGIVSIEAFF